MARTRSIWSLRQACHRKFRKIQRQVEYHQVSFGCSEPKWATVVWLSHTSLSSLVKRTTQLFMNLILTHSTLSLFVPNSFLSDQIQVSNAYGLLFALVSYIQSNQEKFFCRKWRRSVFFIRMIELQLVELALLASSYRVELASSSP